MDKKSQVWTGIIFVLLAIVGLWFWFRSSVPSQSDIKSATKTINPIDPNVVSSQTASQILSRQVNGNIPVTVSAAEIGRDNPFSDY